MRVSQQGGGQSMALSCWFSSSTRNTLQSALKTFALVFVDVEIKINMACVQGIDRNDGGAFDITPSPSAIRCRISRNALSNVNTFPPRAVGLILFNFLVQVSRIRMNQVIF